MWTAPVVRQGTAPDGSISEKLHVRINGVDQGMFLEGRDLRNPLLLFLHGGPGLPGWAITAGRRQVLEEQFTVCWWEQRGTGLSNHRGVPPETVTVEQLVADTVAVADYLRSRFGREKVYLMAHSWGTFLGVQAAARAPDRFHAYIAMAQVTRQLESEKLAYAYMLEQFENTGDHAMVRQLRRTRLPELDHVPSSYRGVRDRAMHQLGIGTTRDMRSVVTGIFLPVWRHPDYSLAEKVAIWRGKWSARSQALWNEMIATDLATTVRRLDLPVYLLHGLFDYTVSYDLAEDFFRRLQAPVKAFYSFEHSAHTPLFEEPDKMAAVLREDVRAGAVHLADSA